MSRTLAAIALLAAALGAQAQQKAGQVLYVAGEAMRVGAEGTSRPLKQGDAVLEGDLLRTGPAAHLQLSMRDEAFVALRPDTELRLKRYSDGEVFLELVKGTLRSISGMFGNHDRARYRLGGHHVVLGIRGTDHEATQRGEGFYDRVSEGGTYLQQGKGRVDVPPGRTGFAPRKPDGVPVLLPRTPEFALAFLPPAAAHAGPRPRDHAPIDLKLPTLPAAARFDTPPVGGPAEHPGLGKGRPPRPNGKGRD